MSTIKVTNVNPPTAGNAVNINGLAYPTAGPLSNRNLIINGAMQVAQRGTTFTGGGGGGITLDMWKFSEGTSAVFDVAQSSTAPAGFTTSFKVDCTTTGTPTGSQEAFVETKVEAQNLQHLQYGTSGAQTTTLSFWVRSNKTGDYGLWFYHYDLPGQYATTYTISSADTWEYKTITLPGNTTAAFANDNTTGLAIRFYLQIGPDLAGTPSETWQTTLSNRSPDLNLGDSTSNEWLITGVQLEVGQVATPFEHRSFGDELLRCQRYYQKSYEYNTAPGTNTDNGKIYNYGSSEGASNIVSQIAATVAFRTSPTITWYTPGGTAGKWNSARNGSQSDVTMNSYQSGEKRISGYCALGAAWTVGYAQGHYEASAEL